MFADCKNPIESALTTKFHDLSYCRAVVEETLRMRPVAPVGLMHQTIEDTSVMGYKVPKGMAVMPNIWSVHHEKDYWAPDPEVFRPERHLHAEAFKKLGHVIPFGIGWRSCVGPKLVESSLFAYMVTVFYYYDVTLASSDVDIDMAGISTTLLNPHPFKVTFKVRNSA